MDVSDLLTESSSDSYLFNDDPLSSNQLCSMPSAGIRSLTHNHSCALSVSYDPNTNPSAEPRAGSATDSSLLLPDALRNPAPYKQSDSTQPGDFFNALEAELADIELRYIVKGDAADSAHNTSTSRRGSPFYYPQRSSAASGSPVQQQLHQAVESGSTGKICAPTTAVSSVSSGQGALPGSDLSSGERSDKLQILGSNLRAWLISAIPQAPTTPEVHLKLAAGSEAYPTLPEAPGVAGAGSSGYATRIAMALTPPAAVGAGAANRLELKDRLDKTPARRGGSSPMVLVQEDLGRTAVRSSVDGAMEKKLQSGTDSYSRAGLLELQQEAVAVVGVQLPSSGSSGGSFLAALEALVREQPSRGPAAAGIANRLESESSSGGSFLAALEALVREQSSRGPAAGGIANRFESEGSDEILPGRLSSGPARAHGARAAAGVLPGVGQGRTGTIAGLPTPTVAVAPPAQHAGAARSLTELFESFARDKATEPMTSPQRIYQRQGQIHERREKSFILQSFGTQQSPTVVTSGEGAVAVQRQLGLDLNVVEVKPAKFLHKQAPKPEPQTPLSLKRDEPSFNIFPSRASEPAIPYYPDQLGNRHRGRSNASVTYAGTHGLRRTEDGAGSCSRYGSSGGAESKGSSGGGVRHTRRTFLVELLKAESEEPSFAGRSTDPLEGNGVRMSQSPVRVIATTSPGAQGGQGPAKTGSTEVESDDSMSLAAETAIGSGIQSDGRRSVEGLRVDVKGLLADFGAAARASSARGESDLVVPGLDKEQRQVVHQQPELLGQQKKMFRPLSPQSQSPHLQQLKQQDANKTSKSPERQGTPRQFSWEQDQFRPSLPPTQQLRRQYQLERTYRGDAAVEESRDLQCQQQQPGAEQERHQDTPNLRGYQSKIPQLQQKLEQQKYGKRLLVSLIPKAGAWTPGQKQQPLAQQQQPSPPQQQQQLSSSSGQDACLYRSSPASPGRQERGTDQLLRRQGHPDERQCSFGPSTNAAARPWLEQGGLHLPNAGACVSRTELVDMAGKAEAEALALLQDMEKRLKAEMRKKEWDRGTEVDSSVKKRERELAETLLLVDDVDKRMEREDEELDQGTGAKAVAEIQEDVELAEALALLNDMEMRLEEEDEMEAEDRQFDELVGPPPSFGDDWLLQQLHRRLTALSREMAATTPAISKTYTSTDAQPLRLVRQMAIQALQARLAEVTARYNARRQRRHAGFPGAAVSASRFPVQMCAKRSPNTHHRSDTSRLTKPLSHLPIYQQLIATTGDGQASSFLKPILAQLVTLAPAAATAMSPRVKTADADTTPNAVPAVATAATAVEPRLENGGYAWHSRGFTTGLSSPGLRGAASKLNLESSSPLQPAHATSRRPYSSFATDMLRSSHIFGLSAATGAAAGLRTPNVSSLQVDAANCGSGFTCSAYRQPCRQTFNSLSLNLPRPEPADAAPSAFVPTLTTAEPPMAAAIGRRVPLHTNMLDHLAAWQQRAHNDNIRPPWDQSLAAAREIRALPQKGQSLTTPEQLIAAPSARCSGGALGAGAVAAPTPGSSAPSSHSLHPTVLLAPQRRATRSPKRRTTRSPQRRTTLSPQRRGPLLTQPRPTLSPWRRGTLSPQRRGAFSPQRRGPYSPQRRGPVTPLRKGTFSPPQRVPMSLQRRAPMSPPPVPEMYSASARTGGATMAPSSMCAAPYAQLDSAGPRRHMASAHAISGVNPVLREAAVFPSARRGCGGIPFTPASAIRSRSPVQTVDSNSSVLMPGSWEEAEELRALCDLAQSLPQLDALERMRLWERLEQLLAQRLARSPRSQGRRFMHWPSSPGIGQILFFDGTDAGTGGVSVNNRSPSPLRSYATVWESRQRGCSTGSTCIGGLGPSERQGRYRVSEHMTRFQGGDPAGTGGRRATAEQLGTFGGGSAVVTGVRARQTSAAAPSCSSLLDSTLEVVHDVIAPNATLAHALTLSWQAVRSQTARMEPGRVPAGQKVLSLR